VITTSITRNCVACFEKAIEVMKRNHIKRLPITHDGRIVGIITARDVVEAYAKL
jgi:CBS domain-containing protein